MASKTRKWQNGIVPALVREFHVSGGLTMEFLLDAIERSEVSPSDKQRIEHYRDWAAAQVKSGQVCRVGDGTNPPLKTGKALSSRGVKAAIVGFDALEAALDLCGGADGKGRGRKAGEIDLGDLLDDLDLDDDDDSPESDE